MHKGESAEGVADFLGRDDSTVHWSKGCHADRLENDPDYKETWEAILNG